MAASYEAWSETLENSARVAMQNNDNGYFPRGTSILRELHENRMVGATYGARVAMVGSLYPMIVKGVVINSAFYNDAYPATRGAHTLWTMEQIWFGTRAQADRELKRLYRFHRTVRWTTDEPLASYPPGDYEALMPDFLLGTLMVIADSAEALYQACVRPLDDAERETLWQEYLLMGELFGLPRTQAPQTYHDYRKLLTGHMDSADAFVIPESTAGYEFTLRAPVPKVVVPVRETLNLLIIGSMPQRARDIHGVPWNASKQRRYNALTAGLRLANRAAPASIRRGRVTPFFNLAAATEKRIVDRRLGKSGTAGKTGGCPIPAAAR